MYIFKESSYSQNQKYLNQYLCSLSFEMDSFQEEHILKSRVFSIFINNSHQGYFAFCENVFDIEGFTVLTQFVLDSQSIKHAEPIFEQLLKEYKIISAFVASADEFLLTLSMDFHKSVTMQAYMFADSKQYVRDAEYPRSCIVEATGKDLDEIQRLSNDYFDFLEEPHRKDKFQLYILKDGESSLGFGLVEEGIVNKGVSSLGIYTIEEHRKKGVGRSLLLHLKNICYEKGTTPITGCNWYNKKSKATIESAGFVAKTRLFKIEFTDDAKWVSI